MSIQNFGGMHTPVCDICGDELPGEFDFYDAVSSKKREGWRGRKVDGEWQDICCVCQEENGHD